jgi:SPP1 family predicted phage head-tail adaptor
MRGGRLRKRIQIQTFITTADGHGTPVKTWSTAATVWGAIEPVSGKEGTVSGAHASQTTHKITIRFYSGLNSKARIAYLDTQVSPNVTRIFEIQSILNTNERGAQQEIMATEGAPNA